MKYSQNQIKAEQAILQADLEIREDDHNVRHGFYGLREAKIGRNGNIFVLDAGNHRILKFSNDNSSVLAIGNEGKGPAEFEIPTFFDMDTLGRVYVYDSKLMRISIFNDNGKYLRSLSIDLPVGDMTVDNAGNIFLLLRELYQLKGTQAYLWKYRKETGYSEQSRKLLFSKNIVHEMGSAPGDLVISTMDTGPSGELFICFFNEYAVHKFSPEGRLIKAFGRVVEKPKFPDFWRDELIKRKKSLGDENFKIPEFVPNVVGFLNVDNGQEKIYVQCTAEGIMEFSRSNGIPVVKSLFLDRYSLDGNLEKRLELSTSGMVHFLQDIEYRAFLSIAREPENFESPKIVRYFLNLKNGVPDENVEEQTW